MESSNSPASLSLCSAAVMEKFAQHCSGVTMARISSSEGSRKFCLITHQLESWPVRWNSAHGFNLVGSEKFVIFFQNAFQIRYIFIRGVLMFDLLLSTDLFLMLLSEWAGNALLISSILILFGLSRDFQKSR